MSLTARFPAMLIKWRKWLSLSALIPCLTLPSLTSAIELSPLSNEPYQGDLPALQQHGVIRVLVAADLGFYYIQDGQPKGIIAELLNHFEKEIHHSHPKLKIQVIPVQRDDLLPAINHGFGDLAVANLTVTPTRLQHNDFSNPIISDIKELIVTNKQVADFTSFESLSGKDIWIRPSSSYFESLTAINQTLEEVHHDPIKINFIEESLQDFELMEMINQNILPATVLDSHKATLWQKQMANLKFHHQLPIRTNGKIGWAMRKNSPKLETLVNRFIKKAKKGTLLGNVIYGKYLDNTRWLKTALSPQKIDRLNNLSSLFQRYSEQYQFDWLMISAQSFQESRFNNRLVSHAGAVGLMQVLPQTAREPYINIKNIYNAENNVHAGVKYLRFIKDRYYNDPTISPDNQIYFSLASYNAGPTKIRKMRRLAAKHGYNPNVWFNNVEVIARRYISQEPANYVANISRYYVIYKQLQLLQNYRDQQSAGNTAHGYRYF